MLKAKNRIYLSWDDVDQLIDTVCARIPIEIPLVDSVYGIPRGGLIPATLISHRMGLPYVDRVGKHTLVVDDICDSGLTLKNAPGVYTAVLHHKPVTACFTPDVWAEIHTGDEWVIYPWETKDSDPIQDYLK